jgi:single-stranded-DNA-specific exonuclease
MYTQKTSTQSVQTHVVGVTFEGRQAVVALLQPGEEVLLVRDPHNPYDSNAIKVVRQNGQQIGFLDRYLAARLSGKLDQYGQPVEAIVTLITGGYSAYASLGVVIEFELSE